MKYITKKGREVEIRVINKNDAKKLLDFINPIIAEDTFIMRKPGDEIKLSAEKIYLKDQLKKIRKKEGVQIVAEYENRIVGSVDLRVGLSRSKHTGEIGIVISSDFREEGLGQKLLEIIEKKAKDLGLKQISLGCLANNERAIHIYHKLGFIDCGVYPKKYYYKNQYIDSVEMYKEV